ncbi:MAG: Gx transporter family protein [Roseburia sp.]|nr:Gx transporter family protein [Roseburia sp.]MCM1099014.1 Gx transporter family protein [Ruminococcus flavefaciens]
MSVRKMTLLALYATISLAIYAAESILPPPVPIPGIKLGLANIITLILLRRYSLREAALVLTVRILLSALLFGQAVSLFYSLSGGFLSLLVMFLFCRLFQKRMLFLVGAVGGLTHNLGQLLAAYALTRAASVLAYLPFLILSGVLTGLFTGLAAFWADRYLPTRLTGDLK